ncbi:hypothetical protein SAMN04488128_101392 [Chitinophaga eiseniae]|uniref:Uncharacterized protein n=1 Tax=Chitinophaga eiseniae TaxID=634771 RepID=A0A1T4KZ46_9BACT|nr:hypothetical protein SAMN04488128_101392 [Chitinophaga eiseniae]
MLWKLKSVVYYRNIEVLVKNFVSETPALVEDNKYLFIETSSQTDMSESGELLRPEIVDGTMIVSIGK